MHLFTRCLLLVEVISLFVTRCKITHYLLKNLLVTHYKLTRCTLLVANLLIVFYLLHNRWLLVTRYIFTHCSLLVANSLIACYTLQKSLPTKNHSLFVALKQIFFQVRPSKVNTYLNRLFVKTIFLWQKIQQLITLYQKYKQNYMKYPVLPFQN